MGFEALDVLAKLLGVRFSRIQPFLQVVASLDYRAEFGLGASDILAKLLAVRFSQIKPFLQGVASSDYRAEFSLGAFELRFAFALPRGDPRKVRFQTVPLGRTGGNARTESERLALEPGVAVPKTRKLVECVLPRGRAESCARRLSCSSSEDSRSTASCAARSRSATLSETLDASSRKIWPACSLSA